MKLYTNHDFYVRDSELSDIPFYTQLFRNKEWMHNTGFKENEYTDNSKIEQFIEKEHPEDIRWICFHGGKEPVAFIHFNCYLDEFVTVIGGVAPQYLNSGLGIKYYIWCIDLYFRSGNLRKLRSNVYQDNIRSCKMNLGIGFELVGLKKFGNLKFDVYETDRESFYSSPLVTRILMH